MVEHCSDVVDCLTACSNQLVYTEGRVWLRETGMSVSKLPTAETLDPGIITNGPKWWTVSLIRSVWRSQGSGWFAFVLQPACNFITIFQAKANICCSVCSTVESGLLRPVHRGRSAIANMSSDSLSSSTAKTCSAGR